MARYTFERCTGCTTGEVCGAHGYQPARHVDEATRTAALEAGVDQVVTPCTLGRCAPLVTWWPTTTSATHGGST